MANRRSVSISDPQVVVDLYVEHSNTIQQIADRFKCTPYAIRTILSKHNVQTRVDKLKAIKGNPENIRSIVDMYVNKKMSREEIGSLFNCSRSSIGNILDEASVQLRKPGTTFVYSLTSKSRLTEQEIIAMRTAGATLRSIASSAGVHPETIRGFLNRKGLRYSNPNRRAVSISMWS